MQDITPNAEIYQQKEKSYADIEATKELCNLRYKLTIHLSSQNSQDFWTNLEGSNTLAAQK